MNSKALRQQTSLLALNRYISDRNRFESLSASPAGIGVVSGVTATMGTRDTSRGTYNLQAPNGGAMMGKSITTSGLPLGAAVPATLPTGSGNRIDARPVK